MASNASKGIDLIAKPYLTILSFFVPGALVDEAIGAGLGLGGVGASRALTAGSQVTRVLSPAEQKAVSGVLKQIANGTTKGEVYENFTKLLPPKPLGYYREFTAPLASQIGRGESRVIMGYGNEIYYTVDHYLSFTRIK